MKVCLMNSRKAWGGGEKWHLETALFLKSRGHEVVFITSPQSEILPGLKGSGIPVRLLRIGNLSFLNPIKKRILCRFFREQKPDVLIMNLPSDLKLGAPAAGKARVRKIIYRRGSAIPIRNTWLNRRLFGKYVTHILANSKETKSTILENYPMLFPADKIRVIYNGLDLEKFRSQSGEVPIPHPFGKIILGNAGRLVYQKGHDLLIRILSILKEEGLDFHCYVAGDGPLREALIGEAKRHGLVDCLTFLGHVSNMHSFMSNIDIFLLPSRWEGFGYVLPEAMACSKPVVAFRVSSNPELVRDGENGFLADPDDLISFAGRILELASDPGLRESLGRNGFGILQAEFTFERSSGELEKFLLE